MFETLGQMLREEEELAKDKEVEEAVLHEDGDPLEDFMGALKDEFDDEDDDDTIFESEEEVEQWLDEMDAEEAAMDSMVEKI